ncbi:MAG: ROK family protein [Lachnospiraceae bacterium]|nr:ROK family protein [Lachnospiraceae bacterium]MBR0132757.1 ROK family protein [Lachnospiraceae bacterium]
MLYGALEAGGTKMVCAIGDENGRIIEQKSIPTKTPEETMPAVIEYFENKDIKALGIASFGPVELDKNTPEYGHIQETPKLRWSGYDLVGTMKKALNVPIGFDTDVNGSMLGEATWGAAKNLSDALYITIGTGIGGGILSGGKIVHGMLHPELGHMTLVKAENDTYAGKCPFHKNCFEGLAAGPAIEERWGKPGKELSDRSEVWELESYYIAQALANLILITSPQVIILGGGVMHQMSLFPMIREKVKENLNGYIRTEELNDMDRYIIPAALNDDQGIMGCIKLAMDACGQK